MKKNIVIISGYEQFGYHTDTYNYCMYLKEKFNITFISVDCKLPRILVEGIDVLYIRHSNIRLIRGINKIVYPLVYTIIKKADLVFITHFEGCGYIKSILKNKKMILDIRTTEISSDTNRRYRLNSKLSKDINKFEYISVISHGIKEMLNIPNEKSYILPLGAKTLVQCKKDINIFNDGKLSMIYVGTFKERRIEDTIIAFNKLSEKYRGKNLEYTLIGFFDSLEQEKKIKKLISKNKFGNINFIGRIHNEELGKYFEKMNVGLSYVPITEYFNYQPPTKTYEYLFNGLYTIATNTYENQKIITKNNGILIEDSTESLYEALEYLYNNQKSITRSEIIKSIDKYSWENISYGLEQYINSII